jgi:hypothetical protein
VRGAQAGAKKLRFAASKMGVAIGLAVNWGSQKSLARREVAHIGRPIQNTI